MKDKRRSLHFRAAAAATCILLLSGCRTREDVVYETREVQEEAAESLSETTAAGWKDGVPDAGEKGTDEEGAPEEQSSAASAGPDGRDGTDAQTAAFPPEEAAGRRICVYVCGAVAEPGVVELPEGARAFDAVRLAGGFAEDADREFINLAALLSDGDEIRIPTVPESEKLRSEACGSGQLPRYGILRDVRGGEEIDAGQAPVLPEGDAGAADKVNINTADAETLMTLSGIGRAKAEAIIAYRKAHGAFGSVEEIRQVSGIKDALFARIRDDITV